MLPLTAPWNAACGQGWVSNQLSQTCYKVVLGKPKTWNEALWDCNQMGGTLLNIESVREQHYIQGELFQVFYFFGTLIYSFLYLFLHYVILGLYCYLDTESCRIGQFHCIVDFLSFASKMTLHFMIQWLFNTKTKMSFLNRDP